MTKILYKFWILILYFFKNIDNAICEDDNEEECSKLKDSGICEHSQNGFYEHCLKTCGECGKHTKGGTPH